jgi:hypothetical protein
MQQTYSKGNALIKITGLSELRLYFNWRLFSLFLIISLFSITKVYSQLSGTYTVGGSSPYFPNLDSAFNYMELKGVTGNVRLNVRSGTYTLRTTISAISGASPSNTIQVAPDPSNSSPVIFKNTNNSTVSNYLIKLAQSHLRFDSLEFRIDSSSTYGNVIVIDKDCESITFNACTFYGKVISGTNNGYHSIISHSALYRVNKLSVLNSNFYNGMVAISLEGHPAYSKYDTGTVIKNNKISNFCFVGILLWWQYGAEAEGNYIKDINNNANAIGIYVYTCVSPAIIRNQVYVNGKVGYGINIEMSNGSSAKPSLVHSNFICSYDSAQSGAFQGLAVFKSSYLNVYFNTVVNLNKSSTSTALYIDEDNTTSNATFLNNIFYAKYGTAIKIKAGGNSGIKRSNYNLLFSGGPNLASLGTTMYTTLSSIRINLTLDSNSINNSLVFPGLTDLHAMSIELYKKGYPLSTQLKDIDGTIRSSGNPDIGAHIQRLPTLDLSITEVDPKFCMKGSDVYVKIRNIGFATVDSTDIIWQVSENGGSFSSTIKGKYRGALKTGLDTLIKVGYYAFSNRTSYRVKAWLKSPNGKTDSMAVNDTILTKPIFTSLNGKFTIGGSSPDFPTIDSALNTLERVGMCGPVKLVVRSGNYNEKVVFNPITGLSLANPLSLVADSANKSSVNISYNAKNSVDNGVLLFLNVSNIAIKGLVFQSTNTTYSRVVELRNTCANIDFQNNVFTGVSGITGQSTNNAVIFNNGNLSSVVFNACEIYNGNYGFYFIGGGNVSITHCRITTFSYCGIYAKNEQSLNISYNFVQDDNSQNDPIGIYIISGYILNITNNEVRIGGKVSPGGIVLITSYGSSQSLGLVANNIVIMYNKLSSGAVYGFYIFNNYRCNFIHNMSYVSGGNSTSTALYMDHYTLSMEVYNNIFHNYGKGYAAYYILNTPGVINSNNNNFFSSGKYLAYYGANCSNLSNLRSASGNESKSVSIDALYADPFKLEKKVVEIDDKGAKTSYAKKDFNDVNRDTLKPDIGPWEFTSYKKDVAALKLLLNGLPAICGVDSSEVSLVIKNTGSDSQVNVKIYLDVQSQYYSKLDSSLYNKILMPGRIDTLRLPKFKTKAGGDFDIVATIGANNNFDKDNDQVQAKSWTIYATPEEPSLKSDTVCDNESFKLTTNHNPQSTLLWYEQPAGGRIINLTDTLIQSNIKKDTTFYVSAINLYSKVPSSLLTLTNAGVGCNGGVMFNLTPKQNLLLDSFSAVFNSSGSQKVNVYMRRGTFAGHESDSSKWELLDTITANPLQAGGISYPIKLHKSQFMQKDSIYGIYINYDARYTSGTNTYSTTALAMSNGASLCSPFGNISANRIFNGRVFYTALDFCENKRVPYKLKVNKSPVLKTFGKDTAYCVNPGITLLLDPGAGFKNYKWSTGDTTQTFFVNKHGIYSVEVTGNNLCKSKEEISIVENVNPVFSLGKDIANCANNGVNLILNPGKVIYKSFLWSNGLTTKNIKVSTFGTYSLIVTNDYDCKSSDTVNVIKLNNPIVNLGNDTAYCSKEGVSILLDAGPGNKYYNWSNGDTVQTIRVSTKGKYLVEVTGNNGCKRKDSLVVAEKVSPFIKLPSDTFYCKNDGIHLRLDASKNFVNYNWSTNEKSTFIYADSTGTYSVEVIAANGCFANDSIIITEVPVPVINLGPDTGFCKGNTINLTLDAGSGYKTYKWSTSEFTQTIAPQAKGEFSVSVIDNLGCKASDTIVVNEINPKVNLGKDTAYCASSGIDMVLDAGPGFLDYNWQSGENTRLIHAKKEGRYSVQAKARYGCFANDSLLVTKNMNPVVNLGKDKVLNPDLPINETLDAGSAYKSYTWSTSDTSQTISVNTVGYYSVLVSDNNGCEGRDTVQVRLWNKTNVSLLNLGSIKIYPNPANSQIIIESESYLIEEIMILEVTGKEVFHLNPNGKIITINASDWSEGIYLIRYKVNGVLSQVKLLVNH